MSQLSKLEKAHPNIFAMMAFLFREMIVSTAVSPATKAIAHETAKVLESIGTGAEIPPTPVSDAHLPAMAPAPVEK